MLYGNVRACFWGTVARASANSRLLAWSALDVSRFDALLFEATHRCRNCRVGARQKCVAGHESAKFVCWHSMLHLSCLEDTPSTPSRPCMPLYRVTVFEVLCSEHLSIASSRQR